MRVFKRVFAAAVTALMMTGLLATTALAVEKEDGIDCEKAPIYACEGAMKSSYTYTQTADADVEKVTFVCSVVAVADYNDWCTFGALVKTPNSKQGYEFGGASCAWSADFDGDGEDDCGAGANDENTWLCSVPAGDTIFFIEIPVNAAAGEEFTIDFYAPCYKGNPDKVMYSVDTAYVNASRKEVKALYKEETPETAAPTEASKEETAAPSTEATAPAETTAASQVVTTNSDAFPMWIIPVIVGVVVVGVVACVAILSGNGASAKTEEKKDEE